MATFSLRILGIGFGVVGGGVLSLPRYGAAIISTSGSFHVLSNSGLSGP